jgi:hypothetical protein
MVSGICFTLISGTYGLFILALAFAEGGALCTARSFMQTNFYGHQKQCFPVDLPGFFETTQIWKSQAHRTIKTDHALSWWPWRFDELKNSI